MTTDDQTLRMKRIQSFRPPQRHDEGNGRAEKRDEGKDRSKFGQDGQKDGLTLHCKSPRVFLGPEVSSTTTGII